ncbi:uncharacterized protein DNG_03556 [Cephalotrichum gorgonifer]|uniref:HMG box domain-containing protein n=1 Tax=Cephalotrichum gorgonifer TaxID=2041049 RepID=A0AAE8STP8_9PEZI|nr:uncharacterized protein DNG_03556 [Cephalotrichum gorgonifer]
MEQSLRDVFDDLGLSQYLEVFLDQGFDTWDTVLDITETDLEALGVKLGHRRKLQRQIRIARGAPPNAALPAANHSDAHYSKLDSCQLPKYNEGVPGKELMTDAPPFEPISPTHTPQKDRRLRTREELKGQSLSFTEIAKIVGENWQHISQEEREKFERRAQRAKDQYRRELAEYKKTAEYEQYSQYLQDFKKQQQLRGKGKYFKKLLISSWWKPPWQHEQL